MGQISHYLQLGETLHPGVWIPMYFVPLLWLFCTPAAIAEFFWWHLCCQLALFTVVVQLPTLVLGKMSYVDIGWPWGLVLMGASCVYCGDGYWLRRWLVGGCMVLHGLRMGCGALFLFGSMTKWTFIFKEDLPRYQYAKVRWEEENGMPPAHWWIKMQHDTLQQCFANFAILLCPIVLCVFDTTPQLDMLTVVGMAIWAGSWAWENSADLQKQMFLDECKREAKKLAADDVAGKARIKSACLGYAPYDGAKYWQWSRCRHPNYFGEWVCWLGFVIASIPSLFRLESSFLVQLAFGCVNLSLLAFFYDCLMYWTGASPAEHFSHQKRPSYKLYQAKVRCFWPFEVPESLVSHHRVASWPDHLKAS